MTHTRTVCSCGTIITQCRCPGHPVVETVVPNGCERCKRHAPTAVFAACPDCGRSKTRYYTLLEANERCGYGKSTCRTCCLTDIERMPLL
jgi:hypothetical protein